MLRNAERQHALQNVRSGRLVASRIELALDSRSRRRGLLGRDKLDQGASLIIAPCSSIHTFFMRFAIDIVFFDRDDRVARVSRELKPWRLSPSVFAARQALELAPGRSSPHSNCRRRFDQDRRRRLPGAVAATPPRSPECTRRYHSSAESAASRRRAR